MVRQVRPPKPTPTTSASATLREDNDPPNIPDQSAPPAIDLDINVMTVAQLRQHLRAHSIRFPSRARKAELVRLAAEHRRETFDVKFEPDFSTDSLETTPDPTTADQTPLDEETSQPTSTSLNAPAALAQDVETMTIAQLRAYLQDHAIHVPSRARKAQLLEIAKEHHARSSDIQAGDMTTLSAQLSHLSIEADQAIADSTTDASTDGPITGVSTEVDTNAPLPNIPNPTDDISYLHASFNPTFLTIPKLRNLLSAHEVTYTKAKNKADLIQLFDANIVPRAAATIQAMSTVEKTDEGIVDA
ncbi:sister chromatid separation protein [Colletotrichum asianum]|uniref:Sister chromatid separation protein n=1 Tax=Colletotrichum asianum TaxID=702518 RepID=A0A8H3VZB0_9PEZI|nr:sister chromatid separation protein [Colletotrichum asianum]